MSLSRCTNGHIFSPRKHGTTCPYCNAIPDQGQKNAVPPPPSKNTVPSTSDDDLKTLPFWEEKEGIEPVVGWLACIEGPQRGQDYRIRAEKNFIGRSEDMHINIIGDNTISRRNHAVISYNPMQRNFFLIPGDGVGLVFLNNNAVLQPVELSSYDVIQMGKSKFVFVALCGIHFDWESVERAEAL